MAFDESLAERIRHALARKKGIEEKKMFGGIFFMKNGHTLVGVWKRSLIAQVGAIERLKSPRRARRGLSCSFILRWNRLGVRSAAPIHRHVRFDRRREVALLSALSKQF